MVVGGQDASKVSRSLGTGFLGHKTAIGMGHYITDRMLKYGTSPERG